MNLQDIINAQRSDQQQGHYSMPVRRVPMEEITWSIDNWGDRFPTPQRQAEMIDRVQRPYPRLHRGTAPSYSPSDMISLSVMIALRLKGLTHVWAEITG